MSDPTTVTGWLTWLKDNPLVVTTIAGAIFSAYMWAKSRAQSKAGAEKDQALNQIESMDHSKDTRAAIATVFSGLRAALDRTPKSTPTPTVGTTTPGAQSGPEAK